MICVLCPKSNALTHLIIRMLLIHESGHGILQNMMRKDGKEYSINVKERFVEDWLARNL